MIPLVYFTTTESEVYSAEAGFGKSGVVPLRHEDIVVNASWPKRYFVPLEAQLRHGSRCIRQGDRPNKNEWNRSLISLLHRRTPSGQKCTYK